MRSLALANSVLIAFKFSGTFQEFVKTERAKKLRILEINEAGGLTPILEGLPNWNIARYPDCNMMELNLPSGSHDLVLHSDTLEHITDPVLGLAECFRVLAPAGHCIFTIPIIVGRLSLSRKGMKPSYHGNSETQSDDYVVHTEFGSDMWEYAMRAGFSNVSIHSFEYPSAMALDAAKHGSAR